MIELKYPPAVSRYADHTECKALPYSREVKHIAVSTQEGKVRRLAQGINAPDNVAGILRKLLYGIVMLAVYKSYYLLLQLFLHNP